MIEMGVGATPEELAEVLAERDALRAERDEAVARAGRAWQTAETRDEPEVSVHEVPSDHAEAYDLRLRLKRAIRWLRDAEDIARVNKPAWPTADRIRSIYEQITEDVLNGRTSLPSVLERLESAESESESLRAALAELVREADWLVQCLQNIIAQKPVRGLPEAEAGFQAAWQKAREVLER